MKRVRDYKKKLQTIAYQKVADLYLLQLAQIKDDKLFEFMYEKGLGFDEYCLNRGIVLK